MVMVSSRHNLHGNPPSHQTFNVPDSACLVESAISEDAVLGIREDWDRLSATAQNPNVFTTFDWYEAWYRCFAQRDGADRLRRNVLVFKRNGIVCGISPLAMAITSQYGVRLRRLQFVAREHEWDYNDLVVGDEAGQQVAAFAEYLKCTKGDWDLVDLMDLRATEEEALRIQNAIVHEGLHCLVLPAEERCPYFPIEGTWEQMLLHRSRSTRHSFRNRQARQEKFAGDRLRVRILDTPHTEPGLLKKMIELETQKRSKGVLSVPFLGKHAEVFESLWTVLGTRGWLYVSLLELDDRLLAFQLLFRSGKRLWGYLTAFDHEFAYLSPGSTLVSAASDYGFANGFDEFDLLSGEEPYKLHWATGFNQRARILIWNDRLKSRLYAAFMRRRIAAEIPVQPVDNFEE
jgi:CelD/BcsL family acetyltransferase involved in cellulose biosynthesis